MFDTGAWVSPVPAPAHIEPRVARVSLHPGILAAARLPLVVAHGAGKAAILASVLGGERGDGDERRWPARVARRPGAVWILDRPAAVGLPG
jgi:6-phosphogluconolactonase/glucosamine-6-phosphate isomerase/deaminase